MVNFLTQTQKQQVQILQNLRFCNLMETLVFTNEFGQVITEGDEVVVVTTGYSRVYTSKGIFKGVHKNGGVQVEVPSKQFRTVDENGKATPYKIGGLNKYGYVYGTRLTTLQLNRVYKLA